jgi:hypothetical protein
VVKRIVVSMHRYEINDALYHSPYWRAHYKAFNYRNAPYQPDEFARRWLDS